VRRVLITGRVAPLGALLRDAVRAELARYRSSTLRRGDWQIGARSRTTAITLHWNGPAVPEHRRRGAGVFEQLKTDVEWQTRSDWPGAKGGADGLQYHAAVDADGVVWHCRDLVARLWHCGHAVGNSESLSLHVLAGRGQAIPDAQWRGVAGLIAAWQERYRIPSTRVFGHQEWKASECPGPELMRRLVELRQGITVPAPPPTLPAGLQRFVVNLPPESRATVRQGPGRAFPIAGSLKPGVEILVDALLDDAQGETIAGGRRWAHMARVGDQQADMGFIHISALQERPL
jgi:hypothetical protein